MKGRLAHELDADVPAAEAWRVYGTLRLVEIVVETLPNIVSKIDVEHGEGGVGTVLNVTINSGISGPSYQKEKFVRVDDEQRVKEVIIVKGGMLEFGFTSYTYRFEIVEKDNDSCIIRSVVEFEIDEEHVANVAYASTEPLASLARAVSKNLLENTSHS